MRVFCMISGTADSDSLTRASSKVQAASVHAELADFVALESVRHAEHLDQPRAERVRLDPRVGLERDVNDATLLRIQVVGDEFTVRAQRLVGQLARELLELRLTALPEVVDLEL